eukprot:TRINITY_DN2906_c1_g1_i1.p2 TRINITY_DN2906_c1_g1~~TRINITY_DN2906_c1_g1_i1.p2  ORF type:complete len:161 (+),score=14.15 TRINITY_DN2906_c1_g1_i1:44-526(+)
MFRTIVFSVVCAAVVSAGGGCPGGCTDGKVCCHSDNVSYNGKCYDNSTQHCCQTWDAPQVCNKTTSHCAGANKGCAAGPPPPPHPPVCTKASIGECMDGQKCCYANHNLALLGANQCFWPQNETCCIWQFNTYQPKQVAICNTTQICDHKSGCKKNQTLW